jgi:hypothetical protein
MPALTPSDHQVRRVFEAEGPAGCTGYASSLGVVYRNLAARWNVPRASFRSTLNRVSHPGPAPSQTKNKQASRHAISRALFAIHSHPWLSWIGFLAYAAAVTFPHENVQWFVNEIAIRITHPNLYRLSAAIALTLGVLLTALLLRGARRQPQGRLAIGLWFLTVALIVGAWGSLTANNVELVHYPQYFPEGMALAALTLSPVEALSWVVVFGGLDESYQYWALSKGRPTLLDFNDIYMDLLGGAAGIVFGMVFLHCVRAPESRQWMSAWKRPGVIVIGSILTLGAMLRALGLMLVVEDKTNTRYWFAIGRFRAPSFWAQIVANGPNRYHTLTPLEGVALILCTIALYAVLSRKYLLRADA